MKNQRWLFFTILSGLLLVSLVWLNWPESTPVPPPQSQSAKQTPASKPQKPKRTIASNRPKAPEASIPDSTPTEPPASTSMAKPKKVLKQILNDYEQSLQFPMYSRPLSTKDHALLHPNEFISVKRYLPGDASIAFYTKISQFLLFRPEPIPVQFWMESQSKEALPQVQYAIAEIWSDSEKVFEQAMELKSSQLQALHYTVSLEPSVEQSQSWQKELQLRVRFLMNGFAEHSLITPFRYVPSVASIVAKGEARIQGAHLLIPMHLKVESVGHYQITANLWSQKENRPIAHLMVKQAIKDEGLVTFRVHAQTLRHQNAPGPYLLKDIQITKIPESFKEPEMYGNAGDQVFEVKSFPLSAYPEEVYSDPIEQKRLYQLRRILSP